MKYIQVPVFCPNNIAAKFRVHVDSGLQLYSAHHVGRVLDVRLHVKSQLDTTLTVFLTRTFSQGLAK